MKLKFKIYQDEITYFIQGKITRRIKIGKTTTTVGERLRTLQTGSPDELGVIGICFGPGLTERSLHGMFSSSRLHGEWFAETPDLLKFIEKNSIRDELAFSWAYWKIKEGFITFNEAVAMGNERLEYEAEQALRDTVNKLPTL